MRGREIARGIALLLTLAVIPAVEAKPNDQVYRVQSLSCGLKNAAFSQTGFRAVVESQVGLITALHGVVGCARVMAVQEEALGNSHISDLTLSKVSVPHDVAFFTSPTLAQLPGSPLRAARGAGSGRLTVVGYPQESLRQLEHPLEFFDSPLTTIARQFGGSDIERALRRRKSPSVDVEILMVRGALQNGYSGAPVLTSANTVVGVGNGGLAQGFAQINWVIPFAGLPWTQYGRNSREIRELENLDASSLFHSPWTGAAGMPRTGAEVSGTILYNGSPVTDVTRALAVIELMEVDKRRPIPVDFRYDNGTGRFTIRDVPPGKYLPFVRLEAGYPFHVESGGDFHARISGLNPDIVVAPHDTRLQVNLEVIKGIHLNRPADNQVRRKNVSDPPTNFYPSFYAPSAEVFEWEPVPGAAYYKAYVLTVRAPGERPLRIIEKRVSQPRFSPELGVSPPGTQYMFRVEARNATDELIGTFDEYYKDGSGGWLIFRVIPGPQPGGGTPRPEPNALRGYLAVQPGDPINGAEELGVGTRICTLRSGVTAFSAPPLARHTPLVMSSAELYEAFARGVCRAVYFANWQQAERVFPPSRIRVRLLEIRG